MQVGVGDLLTIKGKGFRSGKNKNTVVFKRFGQRAIFVKAESATSTVITLHVPLKLQAYMKVTNNQPVPSVFAIRIIARRFGQKFTSRKLSPTVGPAGTGLTPPGTTPTSAYEQCLSAAQANPSGDEDKDSLTNDLEKKLGTDPCRADTDTDGMSDGWEYQSALDLNTRALPYPGTKPWPNPLDPTDGANDHDGDGLTASEEFALWQYLGSPFNADGTLPAYSDGTQNTGGMVLTAGNPALQALDLSGDGNLTDDERDADQDGLSNEVTSDNSPCSMPSKRASRFRSRAKGAPPECWCRPTNGKASSRRSIFCPTGRRCRRSRAPAASSPGDASGPIRKSGG